MSVHVMARADELHHEESRFGFGETFALAEHVHEGATGTKLESHVDVGFVFKAFAKVNDVGMRERAMDLNFCIKLEQRRRYHNSDTKRRPKNPLWF